MRRAKPPRETQGEGCAEMARNKHPEETVAKILDVATRLFMERGYDCTSMQDIVDNLGGLTKGAVYHHFKGTKEIFNAAIERVQSREFAELERIRDDSSLTGLEKLRLMAENNVRGTETDLFTQSSPSLDPIDNSRLLGLEYRDCFELSAHRFLQPVIEQGVADGTMRTEYPQQLAEVISLVSNLWAVPLFYPAKTIEEQRRRTDFLNLLLQRMGIDMSFDPWPDERDWERFYGERGAESVDGADGGADASERAWTLPGGRMGSGPGARAEGDPEDDAVSQ